MRKSFLLIAVMMLWTPPLLKAGETPEPFEKASGVVLLHGLARSASSFKNMEAFLNKRGYPTLNIDYPSTDYSIETLCRDHVAPKIRTFQRQAGGPLAYVTHSMGGILLRYMVKEGLVDDPFRAVMLGPPNQGSEVVDKLGNLWLFSFINGPAGSQMGTETPSMPLSLGPATFEVGVIAGTRTINFLLSAMIPGTDDGKVSVARARLEGMADFKTIPATHPFIMKNKKAMALTLTFLETGSF